MYEPQRFRSKAVIVLDYSWQWNRGLESHFDCLSTFLDRESVAFYIVDCLLSNIYRTDLEAFVNVDIYNIIDDICAECPETLTGDGMLLLDDTNKANWCFLMIFERAFEEWMEDLQMLTDDMDDPSLVRMETASRGNSLRFEIEATDN